MTREEAKNFSNDINSAIESVLRKYNLTKKSGGVKFGEREVKFNITMEQLNNDGSYKADPYTETMLKHEFSTWGIQSIPSTIVGSKIRSFSGKEFVITGYNRKAQKYPVEAQEIKTGQMYKMSARGLQFI